MENVTIINEAISFQNDVRIEFCEKHITSTSTSKLNILQLSPSSFDLPTNYRYEVC